MKPKRIWKCSFESGKRYKMLLIQLVWCEYFLMMFDSTTNENATCKNHLEFHMTFHSQCNKMTAETTETEKVVAIVNLMLKLHCTATITYNFYSEMCSFHKKLNVRLIRAVTVVLSGIRQVRCVRMWMMKSSVLCMHVFQRNWNEILHEPSLYGWHVIHAIEYGEYA